MKRDEVTNAGATQRDEGREVVLLRAGGLAFAVYADECEGVTPWAEPAPLPRAPAAVLGVVSVRGRMRTLLDPVRLFEAAGLAHAPREAAPRLIASIKGDEQLALALEADEAATLGASEQTGQGDARAPVRATFSSRGETVYLLDTSRLFEAAMSGTERRRRRNAASER